VKLDVGGFLDLIATAINQLCRTVAAPLLLVSTYHGDIELTAELRKRLQVSQPVAAIDNRQYDHYQIKGVLSKVSMLFAMRLHAMILASSSGTPIAGLAYQPKVQHYFDQLGIADSCTDFQQFSSERIHRFLLANWERRQATREILAERIPQLQQKAMIAADCVAELDAGR
jgi:polysaccharide pyruvyl transferase WcaK-like protein